MLNKAYEITARSDLEKGLRVSPHRRMRAAFRQIQGNGEAVLQRRRDASGNEKRILSATEDRRTPAVKIRPMKIELSPQQKALLRQKLIAMFRDDFEEELSDFKADQILDAFIEKLGPGIYNAAIEEMKIYLMNQIEDLDALFQK
jgi:uncharacterized protein (DUF2164 family)